ncbi:MAG: hypothetical protein FJW68_02065 [Actinobacteria bacterium]|nr:hypothetical protein [Actinomycetota bacterium]
MLKKQGKNKISSQTGEDGGTQKIINISTGKFNFQVHLNETKTAEKLIKSLPVCSKINRWGDEIYFSIPVNADIENGVEEVDIGTVAFWPPGSAFCIFFGKTPASSSEKPRAASPVTVVGKIAADNDFAGIIEKLRETKSGQEITVSLL